MLKKLSLLVSALVLASAQPAYAVGEAINGFPNWSERVILEWMNRARAAPQVEMQACGSNCGEAACYTPVPPLGWNEFMNHAARFHSAEMLLQMYFMHDSDCTVVSNIKTLYPTPCNGAASCACQGGKVCPGCAANTTVFQRIALFAPNATGEIIASSSDPNTAFYQWRFESYSKTTCAYDAGPPTNGHRWQILKSMGSVGAGLTPGAGASAVGDFSSDAGVTGKIPSGSHYPQQAASVDAWANYYDTAAPQLALLAVDGNCMPMTLKRGTGTNGAWNATVSGVGTGCHRYYFLFKDAGGALLSYPTTGSLAIGSGAACPDYDPSRPAAGASCGPWCMPSCSGKSCGDNGCGGSCGTCGAGMTCQTNQCVSGSPDGGSSDLGGGGSSDLGGGGSSDLSGGGSSDLSGGGSSDLSGGDDGGGTGSSPTGCSCESAAARRSPAGALAAVLLLGALLLRRRRTN